MEGDREPRPERDAPPGPPRLERLVHALGADDPLPVDPDLSPDDPAEPGPTHRPHEAVPHRAHPAVLAAVLVGGALGTLARYGALRAWPTPSGHFPTALFVVNTTGAFALGLLLTFFLEHVGPSRFLRPFLTTGFLGGWTTYSTLAVDAVVFAHHGAPGLAVADVGVSLVAGLVAVTLGIALGRLGGRAVLAGASPTVPEPEEAP